eukprot:PhM_4_TR2965/c0_g1_i1/m.58695/K07759/PARG; poly(ADP-ribose) glycohydrolase
MMKQTSLDMFFSSPRPATTTPAPKTKPSSTPTTKTSPPPPPPPQQKRPRDEEEIIIDDESASAEVAGIVPVTATVTTTTTATGSWRAPCKYDRNGTGRCRDGANCRFRHGPTTEERTSAPSSASPPLPPSWQGDTWDDVHLRLPCSSRNVYVAHGHTRSLWRKIETAMRSPILTPLALVQTIRVLSGGADSTMDLDMLHMYLEGMDDGTRGEFFVRTLPWMQRQVLALPTTFPVAVPLLRATTPTDDAVPDQVCVLTQGQVAALLVCCFFCIMPHRNRLPRYKLETASDYERHFPNVNFATLFGGTRLADNVRAKLDCFFYYFSSRARRADSASHSDPVIQVVRLGLKKSHAPRLRESKSPLCDLTIVNSTEDTIERAAGALQLDFANKSLGGGVLGHGCVQEEIRFAICPELMLSRLVCQTLAAHEAVLISGAVQYSDYTGYGSSFRWAGPMPEESTPRLITPPETSPRSIHDVCVLAIDAVNFHSANHTPEQQYYGYWCTREAYKAFVGFRGSARCAVDAGRPGSPALVATGNWGCGVFGGDVQLKALLQLCAASEAARRVQYHTFGNSTLATTLQHVWATARSQGLSVGDVYSSVATYVDVLEAGDDNNNNNSNKEEDELLLKRASSGAVLDPGLLGDVAGALVRGDSEETEMATDEVVAAPEATTTTSTTMSPEMLLDGVFKHLMSEMV